MMFAGAADGVGSTPLMHTRPIAARAIRAQRKFIWIFLSRLLSLPGLETGFTQMETGSLASSVRRNGSIARQTSHRTPTHGGLDGKPFPPSRALCSLSE